ncbi:MAG: CheR family methyltransferase [Methanobacteriota archaeon]
MPKQIVSEGDSERVWTPREILDYHTNTRREDGEGIIFIDESGETVFSGVDIEGKDVLIWGCGMGQYAICAAARGARKVVGFDIDGPTITVARQLANYAKDETLIKVCERGETEYGRLSQAMANDELVSGGDERITFVKADATQVEGFPIEDDFDVQVAVNLLPYFDADKRRDIIQNMLSHARTPSILRIMPEEGSFFNLDVHFSSGVPVSSGIVISNYTILDKVAEACGKKVSVPSPGLINWASKSMGLGRSFEYLAGKAELFLITDIK